MASHREKNYEDLQLLADSFTRPTMNPKFLNSVYALRNAWASRGYLIERERKLLRAHALRFKKLEEFLPKEVAAVEPKETEANESEVFSISPGGPWPAAADTKVKAKSSPVRTRAPAKAKGKVTTKRTKKEVQ